MPQHYLSSYAEPEIHDLVCWPEHSFDQVLVIPALRESPEFIERLTKRSESLLIILVINQPESSAPEPENIALHKWISRWGDKIFSQGNLELFTRQTIGILCVNRYRLEQQIPLKQGVGLARKIGCDLALSLCTQGKIHSPWIYCSDADATLPRDYFNLPIGSSYSAAVLPFRHETCASDIGIATALYESAIRYFAKGLAWAGSPYAYISLGSALAIDARAYAKVRGFPKRSGAEDFYLLNKLAKVGPIYHGPGAPILIAARISNRVPFGTGPAVAAIASLGSIADYSYYAPEIFARLKILLTAAQHIKNNSWQETIAQFPEDIQAALAHIGINTFITHLAKQNLAESRHTKAFNEWFDGFVTLKFIRFLQEHYYPAKPLQYCLNNDYFN